jgi:hypothetical protein
VAEEQHWKAKSEWPRLELGTSRVLSKPCKYSAPIRHQSGALNKTYHLSTAGFEPRQFWQWLGVCVHQLSRKWTETAGLNFAQNVCHPDVIFLGRLWQKQELCLKIGHDHYYRCFDLNARNPATDVMRYMQPGKRHWINSIIAQVFLDLPRRVPEARRERRVMIVSCYPGAGNWRSDRSATFCISD